MTIHRGENPVHDPRRDAGVQGGEQFAHGRLLVVGERAEHEIAQHLTRDRFRSSDADAQPRVLLRAQRLLDAA
jgi:hypothetical protein